MRTTNFARAICAIAIFGLTINSSCAPDHKKTPVSKSGGGGGGGGGSGGGNILTNRAQITKDNTNCPDPTAPIEAADMQKLQADLSQGTPITPNQLPQGIYNLTKTFANLQVTDSVGNAGLDLFRSSQMVQGKDQCSAFSFSGASEPKLGTQDVGRNFPIDNRFEVTADHKLTGQVDASVFHFMISPAKATATDIGVDSLSDQEIAQLNVSNPAPAPVNATGAAARHHVRAQQNTGPRIPTPIKKLFYKGSNVVDVLQKGVSGSSTAQLLKLSDSEYALEITFNEGASTRKVRLVYGVTLTNATAQAGTNGGMRADSLQNTKSPTGSSSTNQTAPPPTTDAPTSTNQQPPTSQQAEDAKRAAAPANDNPALTQGGEPQ